MWVGLLSSIAMTKVVVGGNQIPDTTFQDLRLGKPAVVCAGPDQLFVHPYLEDAASTRLQGNLGQIGFKRREEFLRYPGRA